MAVKFQASFGAGELDPALFKRTTLEKYQTGLKRARNCTIGKTGRIVSRGGRKILVPTYLSDKKVLIFSPKNSGYFLEWGHQYVRVYALDGTLIDTKAHAFTESDLANIHFEASGNFVYIFCTGKQTYKFNYITRNFISGPFAAPGDGQYDSGTYTGTGYDVQYGATFVIAGEEGTMALFATAKPVPLDATESSIISFYTPTLPNISEMRVYRRPSNGGAFGYVGSTTYFTTSGGNTYGHFTDVGSGADYSHSPPATATFTVDGFDDPISYLSPTGVVYQQRLLLTSFYTPEAILGSRPGFQNNFRRDFPLSADSALVFKSGSTDEAVVRRMIDSDGLVVFTSVGIYLNTGLLGPTNLALAKKGNWIIKADVAPIPIPGGVLFVDESTNSIRQLTWSTEAASYTGDELSIFSNHLFLGKQVLAMSFQDGDAPLLYVVFDDGTFAHLTFNPEQQMRAWTPGDSTFDVVYTCGTGIAGKTLFVTKNGTDRFIEITVPRYVTGAALFSDTEAYMGEAIVAMDGFVTKKTVINVSESFTVTPLSGTDYSLPLRLDGLGLFPSPGAGAVGEVLRVFDTDGSSVDLEVTARASNNSITVQPSCNYPAALVNPNLYRTFTTISSGISHLNEQSVSVIVDGYVVSSPNNDAEDYPMSIVSAGSLTLPGTMRAAIAHVGMPYTCDIQTLSVDTVEQRPVQIESMICNKVYVSTYNTRGLYVANKFPASDAVLGMVDLNSMAIDYSTDYEILGNRFEAPTTKDIEVITEGDWNGHGEICIRQVDPIHFEILAIYPDIEDIRR